VVGPVVVPKVVEACSQSTSEARLHSSMVGSKYSPSGQVLCGSDDLHLCRGSKPRIVLDEQS